MIRRLHGHIRGLPRAEQIDALAMAGLSDTDLQEMEELASDGRAGSVHAEYPVGSSSYCGVCGLVDVGEECDLFWHPSAAGLPAGRP